MTRAEPGAWGLAGVAVVMMTVLPSAAQPVEPVAAAAADSMRQGGGRLSPRAALVRSAVLPGWGQAASGHWVKALLFAGAGAGWLTSAVVESSRVADAPTPQEHEDRAARRNTRVLLYLLTATLSAVDAYVDAHLEDFDLDAGNLESSGVQLTIRWGP
ncbi:MAG: hypothetical protein OXG13_16710 [Gemmatimonadaceae bacterium]|nr:hypothetical protein [Gemmatimonadaceae bacterium]